MHLPDLRQRAAHSFDVTCHAVGLCRLLQHHQRLLVPCRRAQHAAQLLPYSRRILDPPPPHQALHQVPVVAFGRGMGMLPLGPVPRLLQIPHGLVVRVAPGVVVGQQLDRGSAHLPFQRLRHVPVQHHPPCCAQVGLDHLTRDVVQEAIGLCAFLLQHLCPAGRLQRRQQRLLRPADHRGQEGPRHRPAGQRGHAHHLPGCLRQGRHPLANALRQIPGQVRGRLGI